MGRAQDGDQRQPGPRRTARRWRGQGWARLHTGIANRVLRAAAKRRGDAGAQEGYS